MPAKPLALSTRPPEPAAETDYDAICVAMTATVRGRWFLHEFARRNRHSDTAQVLAAIARMEAAVVGERAQHASQNANQQVRVELLEMARTIAQTRAEVAENWQPALAAGPAGTADAPDVAAAAERLRQIAWTMRACGVEVAASDQVQRIADTILAADALHNLGDQRSHKLTDVLHYLEHRIERMLDSHLAAAKAVDAEPAPDSPPPQTNVHDQTAAIAIAMQALALADVAAADATEFAVDDDAVPTVTDSAAELHLSPARSVASEPVAAAANAIAMPNVSPPIAAASTPAAKARLSNALAAIETELLAGGTPPGPRASFPATPPKPSAAKPTPAPVADGPLAALMAMSEEERIALFS